LLRGRAVHTANEKNMLAKMVGDPISLEEVKDTAATAFATELKGGYVIDGGYVKLDLGPKRSVEHAKDDAVTLAGVHHQHVAPNIVPTATEVRILIPAGDNLPVPYMSVLDVIHDGIAPIDTKTAAKAPGATDADDSEQLSGQSLAFRARYGKAEDFLRMDVLTRTPKERKSKYHPLKTTRTRDDLEVFVKRVQSALRLVEAEVFLPAPSDAWICSPVWCGYHSTCPYARGRKRPTS
jgi:hypothetical protein